jgi:tyrosyl-DNA phosphodiesterase 1
MQSVWLQDIPSRPRTIPRDPKADDFPAHFERVLDALGAQEGLKALRVEVRQSFDLYADATLI